jgi:phosphoribosylformylglycinamidine synthase
VLGTYRNIVATGALPIALTNCLNFASPESPEIMGQIVASIEGISEAAKNLDFPIVSGNVSLSNQTNERCIKPTPAIGGVGIIKDALKACNYKLKNEEEFIFVIGGTKGHLQNTLYANVIEKHFGGLVPEVNFKEELLNSKFIREAILKGFISASAAVLDGGIIGKLCKMSLASNNNIGFTLNLEEKTEGLSLIEYLFAEDSARFVLTVPKEFSTKFIEMAIEAGVLYSHIGFTIKDEIEINSRFKISIEELRKINKVKS